MLKEDSNTMTPNDILLEIFALVSHRQRSVFLQSRWNKYRDAKPVSVQRIRDRGTLSLKCDISIKALPLELRKPQKQRWEEYKCQRGWMEETRTEEL